MSAIYGFITSANEENNALRLRVLQGWHRQYGKQAESRLVSPSAGLGANLTHFSDEIEIPSPIMALSQNRYAVADALLFNREELLPRVGEAAESRMSDEALLLKLYEREGKKGLAAVNGDFAAAILDPAKQTVTLIRDHLGIRPLYYSADGHCLAFATDLRALACLPGADAAENEKKLYKTAASLYDMGVRETELKNARKVFPGSVTVLRPRGARAKVTEERYWRLGIKKVRYDSDADYQREMRALVEDAIRRRLNAVSGKIAAELSGGLDSSVIDILIHRMGRECVHGSWRMVSDDTPPVEGDERDVIRAVCKQEGITCTYLPYNRWAPAPGEAPPPPFENTTAIREMAAFAAANGACCVFSGQGGDEGVSHRSNRLELIRFGEWKYFFAEMRQEAEALHKGKAWCLRKTLGQILVAYPKRLLPQKADADALCFLNPDFARRMRHVKGLPYLFPIDPIACVNAGGITHRAEACAYLSAPYGVQYLFPYEDYRVMDFAVSIPRHLYRAPGSNRVIYRKAFDDLMPETLRRVDYKDTPAMRGVKPKNPEYEAFFKTVARELDWDRWGKYLNREQAEALEKAMAADEPDWRENYRMLRLGMMKCWLLQNLNAKGADWALKE